MKDAWRRNDMAAFLFEFERWQPLIELPFDQGRLEETLGSFAEVVDAIEGKLKALKLTLRNVPGDQPTSFGKCIFTGAPGVEEILIARAY